MATPESGAVPPNDVARVPQPPWWRALLPHAATAAVAILISIAVQSALAPRSVAPLPSVATQPPAPTAAPPPAPATPVPTVGLPLAEGISRQEIADLQTKIDRLWSAVYLSKAISHIADAEAALRTNDYPTIKQALLLVDDSLSLAYGSADDSLKNPIEEFRRETSRIHDDLYLRPEGLDTRFAKLRQGILTLVEARQ